MTLGRFGGSAPVLPGVSAYTGSPESGPDGLTEARQQRAGRYGDVPIGYRDESVRVFRAGAAQTSADGVTTILEFDGETYDTNALHDNTTNPSRLTAVQAGKYYIYAVVAFSANATGERTINIRLNGTTTIARVLHAATASQIMVGFVATHWNLAVGDYVEVTARQTSGATLTIQADADLNPCFGMIRVSL